MGRQIQVAMADRDESEFINFLRTTSPIEIFEYFAHGLEMICVNAFSPRDMGHWCYRIWNKAFPWVPHFSAVTKDALVKELVGWIYIDNASTAPLIEYTRHNFDADHRGLK